MGRMLVPLYEFDQDKDYVFACGYSMESHSSMRKVLLFVFSA